MMKTLLIFISIILILVLVISYFLARFVNEPKSASMDKQAAYEKACDFWRDYDNYKTTEYEIESFDGYKLHTVFVEADEPSDYYCIISHGYTSSRYGAFKYLHMYHEFGFNCIIYDDRNHGFNAKTFTTMGLKESKDLIAQIDDCYNRYGKNIVLGLQGESMGTALTITALGCKPDVKFVVADCGYCDLLSLLKYQTSKKFHLPSWMVYPASLMSRIFYGYFFSQVSPIKSLYDNEVPICFMHGASDSLIPPHHSANMYFATAGYKKMHVFDYSDHAVSIRDHEDEYWYFVNQFLTEVL